MPIPIIIPSVLLFIIANIYISFSIPMPKCGFTMMFVMDFLLSLYLFLYYITRFEILMGNSVI